MRKEASGKGKDSASKVAKPAVLSAEAAAMEQKLVELRKAMEKERAKREALMANTSGGSIWRNGGTSSGLRSGVKGKGPGEGSPLSAAGASGASSNRRPASVEAQAGQGAAASGSSAAAGRASSARSAGAAAADSDVPSVAGSRLATSGRPANAADPKGSGGGGLAGGRGAAASSSGGGGGGAVGGMSCGTDDNSSLAEGAFNEADSHKSFLDALNEWRRANRGDAEGADAGGAAASTSSGAAQQQRPRSAAMRPVESASLEVQTESRPASRPSSAKPLSYFDKLVINASSRVAGHLASGGPLESLRSSLSGQASGLPRPPSIAARPASAALRPASSASGPGATADPSATAAKPAPNASTSATASASSCSAPGRTVPAPASGGASSSSDPLSILDRLEALERQRQAAAAGHGDDDDEEEGPGGAARIQVTTATGVVLTKGARLPDEVLLPHNEGC